MIVTAVKNTVRGLTKKGLKAAVSDFSKKDLIPIRHFDFKFDGQGLDVKFYRKTELASAYFEALSIFLTYGEDLVIQTARHHRDFIQDPVLKQRVTALIGQEALHSKIHNEWNDILGENDFPVKLYRFLAEMVFKYSFDKFPQPLKLSLMSGIEHYTAVISEFMMKHEEYFYLSDDVKQRGMWMWHMLEESEHKDIAYDVYQTLSGNYALRISGFALASFTILGLVSLGGVLLPFFRRPSNLINPLYWADTVRSAWVMLDPKDGVYGSTFGHILDYLRPDFHPNDHDTSEYMAYYKEKLLNPENGLLSPYFLKEVIPALRSA